MPTKLSVLCGKVMEAGLLVALIVIPLFFNSYSQRVFEPDKAALLRSIAIFTALAWLIKTIESSTAISDPLHQKERVKDNRNTPFLVSGVFRIPLVFPVLAVGGSYVISSLFSVVPGISIWGSYSRLQGTYTFFCYLLFFSLLLNIIRDESQLRRLWITLILTSLPLSLYGLLQHFGIDPMPWGGKKASTTAIRVVSTMGNPNFLGAYLILVFPATLAYVLEHLSHRVSQQRISVSSVITAASLVCITAVQLLCLLFTQSRGPWLGLIAGIFMFGLISLIGLRNQNENGGRLSIRDAFSAFFFAVISIPAGLLPAYLLFVFLKKGFRWLWLSWVIHFLFIGGILITMVLAETPFKPLKQIPYIGRLSRLSPEESGSVGVRMLIWKGALELILANPARSVIGYGPETMQTVYPPYYSPQLAYSSSGRAPVDRSHNETLDVIVTRGLIGLVGYLLLIGSISYFGLKWMGFIRKERDRLILLILMIIGGLLGLLMPRWIEGTFRLSAAGIILGILFGGMLLPILQQTNPVSKGECSPTHRRKFLILGLFSALIAHIVETQFGIAVSATQFYFWIYLSLFIILGLNRVEERPEYDHVPDVRPTEGASNFKRYLSMMPAALAVAVVLSSLGFSLINDSGLERNWLGIIRTSLSTLGPPGYFKFSSGVPIILLVTLMSGVWLFFVDGFNHSRLELSNNRALLGTGTYAGFALVLFLAGIAGYAMTIASAADLSDTILFVYGWIFILISLIAVSLYIGSQAPAIGCNKRAVWSYPFLAMLGILVMVTSNLFVVKADINFKAGWSLREKRHHFESLQFYRKAVFLAPDQDYYHYELASQLVISALLTSDRKMRALLFKEGSDHATQARQINPLHAENYMLLGSLFHSWAAEDLEGRNEKMEQAHKYYSQAIELAPNNVQIRVLWARVYLAQKDFEGALQQFDKALSIDPRYSSTYCGIGETHFLRGDTQKAEEAYRKAIDLDADLAVAYSALGSILFEKGQVLDARKMITKALELDPDQTTARSVLGLIYLKSGELEKAKQENLKILRAIPNDFGSHKNLALLYERTGLRCEAIMHAQKALEWSPEKERGPILEFLERLKERERPSEKDEAQHQESP